MSVSSKRRDIDELSIAVAHWHVRSWGGAEYLATKMADVFGIDTVYTIGQPSPDDQNPFGDVKFYDVSQDLPLAPLRRLQSRIGRVFEYALWEDIDWREYGNPDVLVTSGSTTRAVITPDSTLHINYCHSTPRWFYDLYHDRKASPIGIIARPLVRYLRMRDMTVDPRVDHYIANSPIIDRRLSKYYNRTSEVVYPPLNLDNYYEDGDDGFYLHLGRLDEEKGVANVVRAFEGTDHELILAGRKGDASSSLCEMIERASNIDYRGFISESKKYELLARCRAVVFNGHNEDFGIVPIEANASGKPCLARDDGFPGVYIDDRVNGLCHDGSSTGIRETIEEFETDTFEVSPEVTAEFSTQRFQRRMFELIGRWDSDRSLQFERANP